MICSSLTTGTRPTAIHCSPWSTHPQLAYTCNVRSYPLHVSSAATIGARAPVSIVGRGAVDARARLRSLHGPSPCSSRLGADVCVGFFFFFLMIRPPPSSPLFPPPPLSR